MRRSGDIFVTRRSVLDLPLGILGQIAEGCRFAPNTIARRAHGAALAMPSFKGSAANRLVPDQPAPDTPRHEAAGNASVVVFAPGPARGGRQGWHALPDDLQLILAREAMLRAAATLADQAELLAIEMEAGALSDRGGPDALRLFAAIIRATNADSMGPVGNA